MVWVSDQWLGWWVWWPLLAPTGLCVARCVWPLLIGVCGSIDGLVVCVYVCGFVDGLCLCVWVVMGLDRLIGASWVCVCVWLCVLNQCQRLREKERKKNDCWESQGKCDSITPI